MPSNNFPNIGKLTYGYAHNYFNKIEVTWTDFGGGAVDGYQPDMIINLLEPTQTVIFNNVSTLTTATGTQVLEYSFDGNTVHGELASNNFNVREVFENRVISTIWFRIQTGSSGPITVSVEAWGVR